MESQPQNPEFRNNTEKFHPCIHHHHHYHHHKSFIPKKTPNLTNGYRDIVLDRPKEGQMPPNLYPSVKICHSKSSVLLSEIV